MDKQLLSIKIWLAWLVVALLYAYQYILRIAPGVMMTSIADKYNISTIELGHFAGIYYLGYAVMHLPFGFLYDRFQLRIILSLSVIMIVVGQSSLIYSNSWNMVLIGRFLFGAGSSGAILAVFKIIRDNFPSELFPRVLGISVTVGLIGALAGGYPVQKLLENFTWHTVQLILIGMGIVLMILSLFFIPDNTNNFQSRSVKLGPLLKKSVLSPILYTAFIGGLMVGPIEGFADFWGPSFLNIVYHFSPDLNAFLSSLIFIGMAVGTPLMGLWIEKSQRYNFTLKICAGGMAIFFVALLFFKINLIILYGLFIGIGILCSYQILIIHINNMRVDSHQAALTSAISNMIIMVSGSLYHSIIGYSINFLNNYSSLLPFNKNQYAFKISLSIIPLGLVIALMLLNKHKIFFKK